MGVGSGSDAWGDKGDKDDNDEAPASLVSTTLGAPPSFCSACARRAKGSAIATAQRRTRARFIASDLAQTRDADRRAARARDPTPSDRPRRPPKIRACRPE